ncbi:hypothetical protein HNQ51_002866 [Inhella inkyongensis]|uniref:DUF4194 domain-containing protein n=1 Tax=Inhella inkyongensis TaxID=392593 RepID=A0A840S2W5_9BURK|nr:hypothetical protein [Inhella inkyongensis]MBB5205547.1 hypothetical protein [Inhella inkyongensis]
MSLPFDDSAQLIAQLLARRWLPRSHPLVRKALIDTEVWRRLEERAAGVGLRVVDNVHADHISLALQRQAENAVFGETALNANNNFDLPRDGAALLVVIWALIVLPKRQRQLARIEAHEAGQSEMFASEKPLPSADKAAPVLSVRSLLADFGKQLGGALRVNTHLKLLERQGFILRRGEEIAEGPLLDLLLDYDRLAPRILEGALADVLGQASDPQAGPAFKVMLEARRAAAQAEEQGLDDEDNQREPA